MNCKEYILKVRGMYLRVEIRIVLNEVHQVVRYLLHVLVRDQDL
jgi:hypothetical protein